tara:strand:- start:158 stop:391 length:234 start_codon:yes stop_codon:yes gene_type:complete
MLDWDSAVKTAPHSAEVVFAVSRTVKDGRESEGMSGVAFPMVVVDVLARIEGSDDTTFNGDPKGFKVLRSLCITRAS